MDLFGSGDDSDDETGSDDGADEGTRRDPVSALVTDVRSQPAGEQEETLMDITMRLDGSTDDRTVAARALLQVARSHPEAVESVSTRVIDRLTERRFARPIAEDLLRAAEAFRWEGVDRGAVVEGAIEALGAALDRVDDLEGENGTVPGGGASEVALAAGLRKRADSTGGRRQLVIEATADALEAVPRAYAWQAGLDPIDAIVDMRADHGAGEHSGIDRERGEVRNTARAGDASELRARITDGVALGGIVILVEGTVSQLETITGHSPYPV